MKTFLFFLIILLSENSFLLAQKTQIKRDTILLNLPEIGLINSHLENYSKSKEYKLYPTKHAFYFLRLNVFKGIIDQVQFDIEQKESECVVEINPVDLRPLEERSANVKRFELHPTQNMFSFILLDEKSGRVWHVRWGYTPRERTLREITTK